MLESVCFVRCLFSRFPLTCVLSCFAHKSGARKKYIKASMAWKRRIYFFVQFFSVLLSLLLWLLPQMGKWHFMCANNNNAHDIVSIHIRSYFREGFHTKLKSKQQQVDQKAHRKYGAVTIFHEIPSISFIFHGFPSIVRMPQLFLPRFDYPARESVARRKKNMNST